MLDELLEWRSKNYGAILSDVYSQWRSCYSLMSITRPAGHRELATRGFERIEEIGGYKRLLEVPTFVRIHQLSMERGRGTPRGSSARGGKRGAGAGASQDKPKREAILDLSKYVGSKVRVTFTGGRQVTGILKGFDQLLNLVLDQVEEQVSELQQNPRQLGLAVVRGPTVTLIAPDDGYEEIDDPFGTS